MDSTISSQIKMDSYVWSSAKNTEDANDSGDIDSLEFRSGVSKTINLSSFGINQEKKILQEILTKLGFDEELARNFVDGKAVIPKELFQEKADELKKTDSKNEFDKKNELYKTINEILSSPDCKSLLDSLNDGTIEENDPDFSPKSPYTKI